MAPHLRSPAEPPVHPATREPLGPDGLADLFPMALVAQDMSAEPWIDVPGEVLDVLRLWRPTPLVRATRLEAALGTPARIYYKDESVSPAGSHKANTAVAQAFYAKQEGVRRLAADTGAGRWGSAVALAGALFGVGCTVYMVRSSFEQEPHRRVMIETWGGAVEPSPVDDPAHPGSVGTAVSDAVRDASTHDDSRYAAGSVRNHVLLHQTVIGLEAREQMVLAGERRPDVVVGSGGGGSNLGGIGLPFVPDEGVRLVAVEPSSCPTLTSGRFEAVPAGPDAPERRDHGDAPIVATLVRHGRMEAAAYPRAKVLEAAVQFARTQGAIPAPETAHAIGAVVDEALLAKEEGADRVILFSYSGHGRLDLAASDDYLHGGLDA